jgi:hypothetical protein
MAEVDTRKINFEVHRQLLNIVDFSPDGGTVISLPHGFSNKEAKYCS